MITTQPAAPDLLSLTTVWEASSYGCNHTRCRTYMLLTWETAAHSCFPAKHSGSRAATKSRGWLHCTGGKYSRQLLPRAASNTVASFVTTAGVVWSNRLWTHYQLQPRRRRRRRREIMILSFQLWLGFSGENYNFTLYFIIIGYFWQNNDFISIL